LGACLREHGQRIDLRSLWLPETASNPHIPHDLDGIDAVISLGGPMNVGDRTPWMARELAFLKLCHQRQLPLIGICLGAQMIAKALGGEVGPMTDASGAPTAEWGMAPVRQHPAANTETVLAGVPWTCWQMHAHGQEVKTPPPGALVLQFSDKCKVQSFRTGLRTYAFQYHFEWDLAVIQHMLRGNDPQIALAGITDPRAALDTVRGYYEEFARASDRLCMNLVEYLLPVSRRIVA
ncbi:MAG TPA: type 1 glutamine amidotransferase, partial [Phycisphaerales bacterium]|nr:type 1 glutamine amidotransferase [Phycisphaerales bacterium]